MLIYHRSYPVFDSFESDRKLAGLLTVNLHWSLYFENVLPPSARGYYAVLENTLNQTFTYRVDGPDVVFLGNGDLHETEFDDMGIVTNVAEYLEERSSPATSAYKTVSLNADYCAYTIRVYPSSDTEDDFVTNKPVFYTIVVALVFCFTSFVFLMYDLVVQRRQRIVMARALASGAIVSNLFPREVREQLYNENKQQKTEATESKFLSGTAGTVLGDDENAATPPSSSRPIASLFQDTTVFFGDLAGFTEWSNKRSASDVFELLEAIYSAFDAIASKRNVYKVRVYRLCPWLSRFWHYAQRLTCVGLLD